MLQALFMLGPSLIPLCGPAFPHRPDLPHFIFGRLMGYSYPYPIMDIMGLVFLHF